MKQNKNQADFKENFLREQLSEEQLSEEALVEELLPPLEEFPSTPLKRAEIMREEKKAEIRNLLKMSKLQEELAMALDYIQNWSSSLLTKEDHEQLFEDLIKIGEFLNSHPILDMETMLYFSDKAEISSKTLDEIDFFIVHCYEKGDFSVASGLASFYCMLDMTCARPWLLRAMAYKALENYELAIMSLNNVVQMAPTLSYGYIYLGECYFALKDKEKAKHYLTQGMALISGEEKDMFVDVQRFLDFINKS